MFTRSLRTTPDEPRAFKTQNRMHQNFDAPCFVRTKGLEPYRL